MTDILVFLYLICSPAHLHNMFWVKYIFSSAKMTELFYMDYKWKTYKATLKHPDRLQQFNTDHMSDSG